MESVPPDSISDVDRHAQTTTTTDKEHSHGMLHSLSNSWTRLVHSIRKPIIRCLLFLADSAAAYPVICAWSVVFLSVALLVVGFLVGFNVDVDENSQFTPRGSRSLQHGTWINEESGYRKVPRNAVLLIHANGQDILTREAIRRMFVADQILRASPSYNKLCVNNLCDAPSVTQFWNNNLTLFQQTVHTDQDLLRDVSQGTFPDGTPVDFDLLFGPKNQIVTTASAVDSGESSSNSSFAATIRNSYSIPNVGDDALGLEKEILDRILDLRDQWNQGQDTTMYELEVFTQRSFSDEFTRAILVDIPLVPVVFVVISGFTCLVFFRRDAIHSRCWLGLGAVFCVLLSIMSGFGLLFLLGVPFTSMTQLLPFVFLGVGLDDAFVIMGEYNRTDPSKKPEDRIHDTIEQTGSSLFLTTLTSSLSFALGIFSAVPAARWLCCYAFPTLIIDFLYQITFFVALIVLDERRIQANRRECLRCCICTREDDGEDGERNLGGSERDPRGNAPSALVDGLMERFGETLCHPLSKLVVLVSFLGLFVTCAWSASELTQEFRFTEMVPGDSYVLDFMDTVTNYAGRNGLRPKVYFRGVDQSNPDIQQQMLDYVEELTTIDAITNPPTRFWLKDFELFVRNSENTTDYVNATFREQIGLFLDDPVYGKMYKGGFVLDSGGNVVSSRTEVKLDQVNQLVVTDQIGALRDQRAVGARQPVNQGRNEWAFFTFHTAFYTYEFFASTLYELSYMTVLGVVAVTVATIVFIPHWTAVLFVIPLIGMVYVDLLGLLQFAGLHINVVIFISLVMSIGLSVDYLMHVLLRYYDSPATTSREARIKDTLGTMGSSVLIGGLSTFFGMLPLAFSTSSVFKAVFVLFAGLVSLGISHGLILLPVLLSIFGPHNDGMAAALVGKKTRDVRLNHTAG